MSKRNIIKQYYESAYLVTVNLTKSTFLRVVQIEIF